MVTVLLKYFEQGVKAKRRKWSGEEALESLRHMETPDGQPRFTYSRLPSLLGIKSIFGRGKSMLASQARAAQTGGTGRRGRWSRAEDASIRAQLADGATAADVMVAGRSRPATLARTTKLLTAASASAGHSAPTGAGAPTSAVVGAPVSITVDTAAAAAAAERGSSGATATATTRRRWTVAEEDQIREQLPAGVAIAGVRVEGRSAVAVGQRARVLRRTLPPREVYVRLVVAVAVAGVVVLFSAA